MTITERIFNLIQQKGMTQKDFSIATGIAPSTISDWKRKGFTPSADKIMDICGALNVSPEQLLTGKGIDEESVNAPENLFFTKKDYELIEIVHSLKSDQSKRLMAYLKTLKQLEELEDI